MKAAIEYLERAKVEELAEEYRRRGYDVEEGRDFDLTARNDRESIAFEVRARASLARAAKHIAKLRGDARAKGYSDFRLVVVSPPEERLIEVQGLAAELMKKAFAPIPAELDELSRATTIETVSDLDVGSIKMTPEEVRIAGEGLVEVALEGHGEVTDSVDLSAEFPFAFEVVLDPQLRIQEVVRLDVDTSSFYE